MCSCLPVVAKTKQKNMRESVERVTWNLEGDWFNPKKTLKSDFTTLPCQ